MPLTAVDVRPLAPKRFEAVLAPEQVEAFREGIVRARRLLDGRVVWNVNSTAHGGGVAEMLHSLLAYARGARIDARWVVIGGTPDFFRVTKRIHNHLHGYPGDGGALGESERAAYEDALVDPARELRAHVSPGDVVLLHDPQTAGLTHALADAGVAVLWRCHVGVDRPNDLVRGAWDFLRPDVEAAGAYVFSRPAYAWDGLDERRVVIIPPSIDAFSPKNQDIGERAVEAILRAAGLVPGGERGNGVRPRFEQEDGTPAEVKRAVTFFDGGPPPPEDAPLVVQVSRWDRLKDPVGVVAAFAEHVAPESRDAHLVLAGPAVEAVADDPEGQQVLEETRDAWERLDGDVRARVHLACLPMDDAAENAAIVNALQRHSTVVVQKSLAEGFGLTVTEAMWKARPVVAGRIGGIQDQIVDGESGVLVDDPADLTAVGSAVVDLLAEPARAEAIGASARERVRERFLGSRHLLQYVDLFSELFAGNRGDPASVSEAAEGTDG